MKGTWLFSFFWISIFFETFGEGRSIWLIRWITPRYGGGRKAERCGGIGGGVVWVMCWSKKAL